MADWGFSLTGESDSTQGAAGSDIELLRTAVRNFEVDLSTAQLSAGILEKLIRAARAEGAHPDTLADHLGLSVDAVRRVSEGGSLLGAR